MALRQPIVNQALCAKGIPEEFSTIQHLILVCKDSKRFFYISGISFGRIWEVGNRLFRSKADKHESGEKCE